MKIFTFDHYKKFIKFQVQNENQVRGYKSKLARAANCQKSYLSQVINGDSHFTSEQAIGLSIFWKFSELETDYFLELINLEKTNFPPLKAKLERRLKELRTRYFDSTMQDQKKTLSKNEERALYYSSWHFSATHIITSISGFQTIEAIAQRLELSKVVVQNVLEELSKMNLVTLKDGKWWYVPGGLHNPPGTIIAGMHHQNWRQRAMQDYHLPNSGHLHYTDVHSLSSSDFLMLRDFFIEKINEFRKTVKSSPEENAACLCIDYFKI